MSITQERKLELIKEFATKDGDTGSPEVQVAILSERIGNLTEKLQVDIRAPARQSGFAGLKQRRVQIPSERFGFDCFGIRAAMMKRRVEDRLQRLFVGAFQQRAKSIIQLRVRTRGENNLIARLSPQRL